MNIYLLQNHDIDRQPPLYEVPDDVEFFKTIIAGYPSGTFLKALSSAFHLSFDFTSNYSLCLRQVFDIYIYPLPPPQPN